MSTLQQLLSDIEACRICEAALPIEPRPIVQVGAEASVLIVGQAPGRRVFESGIPFDDPSGDRLRSWMGIDKATFYDPSKVAIVPMGFCYPGKGKSGDLPPRRECAPAWREELLAELTNVAITLVIGTYAISYHLPEYHGRVTEAVTEWKAHFPSVIPLPHPSPRNVGWFKNNPWFEKKLVPTLRSEVQRILR